MVIGFVAPLKFPKIPSARFISSPVALVIINWLYMPAFDPFMDILLSWNKDCLSNPDN